MKYLLFDHKAIGTLVSKSVFQSVEYSQGARLIQHICDNLPSENLEGVIIEHYIDGIMFVGEQSENVILDESDDSNDSSDKKIFCIDLTVCDILSERSSPNDLLTVLQKSFRTATRIWSRQPFTSSERVHGTKSIVFPFVMTDRRRIVIERSNEVPRLLRRGIKFPLLAYKYNDEDAPQGEEYANPNVLRHAGELYISEYAKIQKKYKTQSHAAKSEFNGTIAQITTTAPVRGNGFIFMDYETQLSKLTETQRFVVEYPNTSTPLRVDGAAGTGKTASLIMRAYNLLRQKKQQGIPFSIIFFAHSDSTNRRNRETFEYYEESLSFMDANSPQKIQFTTLLEFCREFANIPTEALAERDAGDAKTYQLLLIEDVLEKAKISNKIRTYKPLLSKELADLFDSAITSPSALTAMLQHEFSIQIKGRTDCTIDKYYDLQPIQNGLPCKSKWDKEFVFSLFNDYQNNLKDSGTFDVDDVIMEALSRLNAPIWRRERTTNGFDYIMVDEMHLFNINEQSVFHYLTRTIQKEVPICFALDYSQAIGDRGNISNDYITKAFGAEIEKRNYYTIFRNSPQIADFCASIAASGTLMFQETFLNPYISTQSNFTQKEEKFSTMPILHMYKNNDDMLDSLNEHIEYLVKVLQCKPNDIAVISFDPKLATNDFVEYFSKKTSKQFTLLDNNPLQNPKNYIWATPYAINGLEFHAVILLGVDEGRVPQTAGTSDVSQHFIKYSAYNLLYLASSRAKYRLILLGSNLNGISSCLEYALKTNRLDQKTH